MSSIILRNKKDITSIAAVTRNILFIIMFIAVDLTNTHAQNSWTQKSNFGGTARYGAVGFAINGKGYIGMGYDGAYKNDFWEYDPVTNAWTQRANFGGAGREFAVGFSIGGKGYAGTGNNSGSLKNDFWEYDPSTNTWTQKSNFGSTARWLASGFSIGDKGYIGTGYDNMTFYKNDFWEYDPSTDGWAQITNFGGTARNHAAGFSIGSKGYVGTGDDGTSKKDFWEYDPITDTWTQKADFSGTARHSAVGFSIGSKGYLGTGCCFYNDFWEYDPAMDEWAQKANFSGMARDVATAFSIGNHGYIGAGRLQNFTISKDFWEYTPDEDVPICNVPTMLSTIDITSTSAKVLWNVVGGAVSYKVRHKIATTSDWTITKALNNNKNLHALTASTEYVWQVKSFCDIKPVVTSEWSEKQFFTTNDLRFLDEPVVETMFEIYPNPLLQSATVSFSLNEASPVGIELMDLNGRSLRVIVKKDFSAGSHEVTFNRESLIAGIYFLQLKTNEGVMMKKMVLLH